MLQAEEQAAPGHFPLGSEQMRILLVNYPKLFIPRVGNSKAAALGPLGAVQNTTGWGSFYNQLYLASPSPRLGITLHSLKKKEQQHFVMRTERELLKCPGSCLKGGFLGASYPTGQQGFGGPWSHAGLLLLISTKDTEVPWFVLDHLKTIVAH